MLLNTIISFVFRFVVAAIWLTVVFFPVRWLAGRATQWFRHQAFKPRVAWGLRRMIFWLLMVAVGLYPVLSLWGVVLVGLWAGVQVALTVATVLTLLETFGKEHGDRKVRPGPTVARSSLCKSLILLCRISVVWQLGGRQGDFAITLWQRATRV